MDFPVRKLCLWSFTTDQPHEMHWSCILRRHIRAHSHVASCEIPVTHTVSSAASWRKGRYPRGVWMQPRLLCVICVISACVAPVHCFLQQRSMHHSHSTRFSRLQAVRKPKPDLTSLTGVALTHDAVFVRDVLKPRKPTLLYVYFDHRQPPREDITNSFRQLFQKRNADQFNMFEMRLQDCPKTAQRLGIVDEPKLLLFRDGQLLSSLHIGSEKLTYQRLLKDLNELVGFKERPAVRPKLSFEEVIGSSQGRPDTPQRMKGIVRPTNMLGLLDSAQ